MTRFEYTVTSESTTINIPALVGVSRILSIARETAETPIIKYLGTPIGAEIKVNLATGEFESSTDVPFLLDEKISGIYE